MSHRLAVFFALAVFGFVSLGCQQEEGAAIAPRRGPGPAASTPQLRILIDPIGKAGVLNRMLVQEFTRDTGITVQVVGTGEASTGMLSRVTQILASRSQDLDVVMIDVIWPPMLHHDLEDLGPMLGQEAADFAPDLLRHNTVQGRLVGIPMYVDIGLFYYRTDLLTKYGFSGPPATWDEMAEMAAVIQAGERAEGNADFWGAIIPSRAGESLTCTALEWQASEGGGTIVSDSGRVTLNNLRTSMAFDRAAGWFGSITPPSSAMLDREEGRQIFQAGNGAFLRGWSYAWELLNDPASPITGRVGIAPMPAGAEGSRSVLGGWQLAISTHSRNKDAAWRLISHLTSEASQRRRAIDGGFPPTRESLYRDPLVMERQPHLVTIREILPLAVVRPSRGTGAHYNQISAIYFTGVESILRGNMTAEEALIDMEQKMIRALLR